MKRKVTLWAIMLFVIMLGVSFGQQFTEDFEDGDVSDWGLYRAGEEPIEAVDMSTVPTELLEGGDKAGYLHDADASYSGAAIVLVGDTLDANYTVEADFYVYENHSGGSAYTGLVVYADSSRQGPASHGYYVKLVADFDADNRFRFYNNQLDMTTFQYTFHHAIDASGVDKSEGWHHMKIECVTNADGSVDYTCHYDETELGTYTDDSNAHTTSGQAGAYAFQMDADGIAGYIDNFTVTSGAPSGIDPREVSPQPTSFSLGQNFPNPFNPSTTISFDLQEASYVTLKIVTLKGQTVSTLVNGHLEPQHYQMLWSGLDAYGNTAPAGVYLAVLSNGKESISRKMLLVK